MMRLFRFDDPEHGEASALLPWLVNGTLNGLERARVERHAAECVACSHELDSLRALQAVVAQDEETDRKASHALARVKARLQEPEPKARATRALESIRSQWRQTRYWLPYAVAAQLVLVVALSVALLHQARPQYYRSLGAIPKPVVAESGLVVVFSEAVPEREVRDLLLRLHARIVDGPSPAGAYTLHVAQGNITAALAVLRHSSSVVFAEPAPQPAGGAR